MNEYELDLMNKLVGLTEVESIKKLVEVLVLHKQLFVYELKVTEYNE